VGARHVRADGHDLAARIGARDVRQRDAEARALLARLEVERAVHRAGPHAHEDFAGSRDRIGGVADFQDFGRAELVEDDGFHGGGAGLY